MEQFDVCKMRGDETVVILQHQTFANFSTRVVAPIVPKSRGKLATSLNPILRYGNRDWVLATHLMNVVPVSAITQRLGSLAGAKYTIKRAIDQLFFGV